jgi:hypothetical protein
LVLRQRSSAGDGALGSPFGQADLEEGARRFCIGRLMADGYADYVRCRLQRPDGGWEACLAPEQRSAALRSCVDGAELRQHLEQEATLLEQLGVISSPTVLLNNMLLLRGLSADHVIELFERLNRPGRAAGEPFPVGEPTAGAPVASGR